MKKSFILFLAASLSASINLQAQQKQLNYDQIFKGAPSLTTPLSSLNGWADDTHFIEKRKDDGNNVFSVDIKTGDRAPYKADASTAATVYVKDNDLYYKTWDLPEAKRLTNGKDEVKNPTLSPDGKYVAFTRNNDLYAIHIADGKEIRYTNDGSDVVYNGWSSWVYYEEILGRPTKYKAFWWSPDSKTIAFMHFNDSQVPMFPLYGSTGQHGYTEKTRYPKAGDPNPEVKIGLVKTEGGNVVWADFNEKDDQYFGMPYWTPDAKSFFVQWLNRGQDNLKIYAVDPENGSKKEVYDEKQSSWVDLDFPERITFLNGSKQFILKSDRTGWAHFYLYNINGQLVNPITEGKWQVTSLLSIDEKTKTIYFTARKEASTRYDLYKVSFNGKDLKRLTFGDYTHQVVMSPNNKYFITTYSNVSTPTKRSLVDNNGKIIKELANSKAPDFDQYAFGKTEMVTIPTEDGYNLPAVITWPANFDPNKKYPILFSIYGGPNAGTVYDGWKNISAQWWAKEGMIQIAVDHRASGHFGKEGVALMHRNLGKWEMHDYIEAVKWLRQKPYVDASKVCITGGSYGGYMTCMALTYGADYFTHGIASSSVTSWELYDSHYVERFMDTPKENPEGYKNGSVLTYAGKYKGLLRIVHGDMDDNVHMQNSIQLISALEDLGKHFEFMIYPGGRHGWGGAKGIHSRNESYRFFYRELLGKPFPENLFK